MGLTHDDLIQIRTVIRDEVNSILDVRLAVLASKLDTLDGRLEALENDVKNIYHLLADAQREVGLGKTFSRLNLEQKLFRINEELPAAVKHAGISLPR